MAKINVDITTKVDISCREGDSFELNIDVTNVGGSAFDFTDKTVLFAIYDARKQPIKICLNIGDDFPMLTSNTGSNQPTTTGKKIARALTKLYNIDSSYFNYVYNDELDYIIPFRVNQITFLTISESNIEILNNNINIVIDSIKFNIPFGVYSYDVKLVSDLEDVLHATNDVSESKYKNSTTWMEGKFTVNKN